MDSYSGLDRMGIHDDMYWADFLGVNSTDWERSGVSVHAHVGLRGYHGFWCFRRNRRTVISAPASWVAHLSGVIEGHSDDDLMLPVFWTQALAHDFDLAIGPAFQGCLSPENFRHRPNDFVRPINETDSPALEEFRSACGLDWSMMPDSAKQWRHAYFEDDHITASCVMMFADLGERPDHSTF